MFGRGEPQLHGWNQAHPASQRFGAAGEQSQHFLERSRRGVVEGLRNHAVLPETSLQIFSGVKGMSMCRTPSGARASTTEFTTAGEQPMVPASPTPLTPSGLTGDGVTVWLLSIHGIMCARGTA